MIVYVAMEMKDFSAHIYGTLQMIRPSLMDQYIIKQWGDSRSGFIDWQSTSQF